MHRIATAVFSLGLAACLPVLAQNVSTNPAQGPSGLYTVDERHTQLLFSVLHLGLTDYFGRFDKISGTLNYNGAQPEQSNITISTDTTSLDVPNAELEDMLKGGAVFDSQNFSVATFKSTSITRTGPTTGQIAGLLTIRNVTRPVTLDATFNGGEANPMGGGYALGFRATATIRRSDFGLNHTMWSPFVSDDVHVIVEAMFDQQKG
jgi:polyisoprenoid-binding protein YceI